MSHKFSAQEATARRLIDQYGASATIRRPGALDESTSPPTTGAPSELPVTAVQTKFDQMDMAAGNTQTGDIKLLVATGSTEPENSDKIVWSGREYSIVSIASVAPAGVPVLWKVIARSGV